MCCMYVTYEVIRSNKEEATKMYTTKTSNDLCDPALWPFHPEMVRDTLQGCQPTETYFSNNLQSFQDF